MESGVTEENLPQDNVENPITDFDTAEDFQKFIYELFERNGILNDLRAYLRGHIVNVLKSAQTGDPPACQKHFTQRLDLSFQSLNILIAEYLLRMDFNYTLSVFISEIPLANMVFEFAKTLMQKNDDDYSGIKFNDTDIWSILNYLGVKCDSTHASSIVQMYKTEDYSPLLLCILRCIPLYHKESVLNEHVNSSNESLSSSIKSSDTLDDKTRHPHRNLFHDKCKHYAACKTCHNKLWRIRDKYRRKKKCLNKNIKESDSKQSNMETVMKNINVMEQTLVEELFEQLKSVYESEVDMVKKEENEKIKRSIANHTMVLKKQRDEMEQSFKAREAELERNMQQKKRFLWGLAKALREQHLHLSKAMKEVRDETGRLSAKEDSVKIELAKAEEVLKKRGEDMRSQISSELVILENHLEDMKKERDNIDRERTELENLKRETPSITSINQDDLRNHYDLLKNEIMVLKKYLDSTKMEPKCVIERSTMTELDPPVNLVLNNGKDDKILKGEDRVKVSQVVNDLKKPKNVNFSPSNLDELFRDRSRDRSRSSASSEGGDAEQVRSSETNIVQQLKEENDRLKTFARQQRSHIDELSSQQARLAAELAGARLRDVSPANHWRPRTAPTVMPQSNYFVQRINTSASANTLSFGWRKGAGEELSLFSTAQPTIVVPGDTLPFIGVLRDRHDTRRHLINQWRALRRRISPMRVMLRPTPAAAGAHFNRNLTPTPVYAGPSASIPTEAETDVAFRPEKIEEAQLIRERRLRPKTAVVTKSNEKREKSPKSVLKEAKEKLRTKDTIKDQLPVTTEKSPNAVLREAKLRLRKLEIEAEAVEQSYLDFRRRQTVLREERQAYNAIIGEEFNKELDIVRSRSLLNIDESYRKDMQERIQGAHKTFQNDLDTYLLKHEPKIDLGETHFKNRNTAAVKIKPIPVVYKKLEQENPPVEERRNNYLETPLTDFRMLYNTGPRYETEMPSHSESSKQRNIENTDLGTSTNKCECDCNPRNSEVKKARHNKKAELEILKKNIGKIYNLQDQSEIKTMIVPIPENLTKNESSNALETEPNKNLLRVEVESVSEVNDIQMTKSQTQDLVLVIGSTATRELDVTESNEEGEKISTQMTIIVTPKLSPKEEPQITKPNFTIRDTPEQVARLTREDVLDAIFNADLDKHNSSEQLEYQLAEEKDSINEEEHGGEDYLDDFSADVDNYNSKHDSEYENCSPISLLKTSEDENFWDS